MNYNHKCEKDEKRNAKQKGQKEQGGNRIESPQKNREKRRDRIFELRQKKNYKKKVAIPW